MNKVASYLKPLMPILSAAYGVAIIYITALPVAGDNPTFVDELLTWLITLAGIALTLFLVNRVEPKVFPDAGHFSLKLPRFPIIAGLLLIAPLWLVVEEYIVYGITSLVHTVKMEPLAYTTAELREDLLSSVHAVLLAPVLEELCFRQMAISPFRRRGAQIAVCVVMAFLFGILHVRNFPGAFISALFYGMVFIWSRNIWHSVALHAGCNLTATLLAVYCWLGLGEMQMTKTPVIILPDWKVVVASWVLAVAGMCILKNIHLRQRPNSRICQATNLSLINKTPTNMKKVTIISTSLRPGSNSNMLAEQFAEGAKAAGHQVELISLRGKDIKFCIGCLSCQKTGTCVFKDDVPTIMESVLNADVVCWATPIYYYEMSGQMKTLIDRMNAMYPKDYKFRDVYLLTTAAENEDFTPKRTESGLMGWIECYEKSELKAHLFCGGVGGPKEIEGNAKLQEAYEMGKNI